VCSAADSIYDFFNRLSPVNGIPQNGMKFSTPDADNDNHPYINCAALLGGSFWYNTCATWSSTINNPSWYSRGQDAWKGMNIIYMMVKLQWISTLAATEDIRQTHASPTEFYILARRSSTPYVGTSLNLPVFRTFHVFEWLLSWTLSNARSSDACMAQMIRPT